MSTYEQLAALPLSISGYELQGHESNVSSGFLRKSTLIRLQGGGEDGIGEDVSYDAPDHDIAQKAGASLPLAGEWTFCAITSGLGPRAFRSTSTSLHGRKRQRWTMCASISTAI